MNRVKQGALLMLAVMVFWTALPASACLLGMQPMRQRDCCRGMARMCGSMGMTASSTCCKASQGNTTPAPIPSYSPQHAQKLIIVPHQASLQGPAALPAADGGTVFEAPPPRAPSGSGSILRI